MADCYQRCSSAGTGSHDVGCYCDLCGSVADAAHGRCKSCVRYEESVRYAECNPTHLLGLLAQIHAERAVELATHPGPWVTVPTDSPARAEDRYLRQCSTLRIWTVYRVFHLAVKDVRRWKKVAVEDSLDAAVSALRRIAPKAAYYDDWDDPPAMRFLAGRLTLLITTHEVPVEYRCT